MGDSSSITRSTECPDTSKPWLADERFCLRPRRLDGVLAQLDLGHRLRRSTEPASHSAPVQPSLRFPSGKDAIVGPDATQKHVAAGGFAMIALDRKPPAWIHPRVVAETAASDFAPEPNLDASPGTRGLYCELCARDADYAPVLRGSSTFCSVECAESVAGLYLG